MWVYVVLPAMVLPTIKIDGKKNKIFENLNKLEWTSFMAFKALRYFTRRTRHLGAFPNFMPYPVDPSVIFGNNIFTLEFKMINNFWSDGPTTPEIDIM